MKKVRIDWNNVQEPWIPSRFQDVTAPDRRALPLIQKHYHKPQILRVVLDVTAPQAGLDFLKEASDVADTILLTLDGGYANDADAYEAEVLPILKEACQICPSLTYIEVGNETAIRGISDEDYYTCYRGAYHALSKLNKPLKLGGTGADCLLNRADSWLSFLQNLAADTDPLKRIDFYSFHENLQDYPVRIWLSHEAHIAWLKEFSLPTLPIFIDGLCLTKAEELSGGKELNLRNAATMITAVFAATEWPEFKLFLKSTMDSAYAHTQFTPDGSTTPNAHANRMLSALEGQRLVCDVIEESWPPQKDIVAVKKDEALSVLVCNPSDEPTYIKFTVADIPYKKLRVHQYLVDDRHNADGAPLTLTNGRHQAPQKIRNSENVEMLGGHDTREELDGTITIECNLREHAFCLFTFEEYK